MVKTRLPGTARPIRRYYGVATDEDAGQWSGVTAEAQTSIETSWERCFDRSTLAGPQWYTSYMYMSVCTCPPCVLHTFRMISQTALKMGDLCQPKAGAQIYCIAPYILSIQSTLDYLQLL